jgi:hypothetical protein
VSRDKCIGDDSEVQAANAKSHRFGKNRRRHNLFINPFDMSESLSPTARTTVRVVAPSHLPPGYQFVVDDGDKGGQKLVQVQCPGYFNSGSNFNFMFGELINS